MCKKIDALLKDPIYSVSYRSQVCKLQSVKVYKLYSRTMSVVRDYLLLPEYHGIKGYQSVDYLNLSAIVCPHCLFSSNSEDDFIRLVEAPAQSGLLAFDQELRLALFESQTEREAILAEYKLERQDLERNRNYLAGFVSYLLGIHCCLIKLDHHLKSTIWDIIISEQLI